MGKNGWFFDVDITIWTSQREAPMRRRHTSAQTCGGTSKDG
jgi:hypothetical protein